MLSLPIPLRMLLASQPELVTPILQLVQRVITRHQLADAQLAADEGHGGAVTLIQRFGSAANLNSNCTAWCWTGCTAAVPTARRAIEADAPTDGELKIIAAFLERPVIEKILTHLGMEPQPPPRGRVCEAVQD